MKAAPFDYVAPRSLAACLDLLNGAGDEAKVLAGGQSLVPMMALRLARPTLLVDLNHVDELTGMVVRDDDVTLGALLRHSQLETDPRIAESVPLVSLAAPYIGHFQIRSRGTLGGSLAHADAAAELPTVARLLDADFVLSSVAGERTVRAEDFFQGVFTTALEPDEIITSVRIPRWPVDSGFAVEEMSRRHGDFALVGAMCAVHLSAGRIDRVAIALSGADNVPVRSTAVEDSLLGLLVEEVDCLAVGAELLRGCDPPTDVHASSSYRRSVGSHLVARSLDNALSHSITREAVRV